MSKVSNLTDESRRETLKKITKEDMLLFHKTVFKMIDKEHDLFKNNNFSMIVMKIQHENAEFKLNNDLYSLQKYINSRNLDTYNFIDIMFNFDIYYTIVYNYSENKESTWVNYNIVDCENCHFCIDCKQCKSCEFCTDCAYCTDCVTCTDCKNCINCTYCIACKPLIINYHYKEIIYENKNCINCVHCKGLTNSNTCRYCSYGDTLVFCNNCKYDYQLSKTLLTLIKCKNLIACKDCMSCTDCINAVGLSNAKGSRHYFTDNH